MKGTETKKKRTREEKKKLAVRIVAIALAALMVLGMAYISLNFIAQALRASDVKTETYTVTDTSPLTQSGDVLISVGLNYGSNLTVGFRVWSQYGYILGSQEMEGARSFTELWDISVDTVSVAADGNLYCHNANIGHADSDEANIGGYHVQVDLTGYTRRETGRLIEYTEETLNHLGYSVIPAYHNGNYVLRIGDFTTLDKAKLERDDIFDIFERYDIEDDHVYVLAPSETCVSVIEPYGNRILFEYDCGGDTEIGLKANEDRNGNAYITTPAGNEYAGVFSFVRTAYGDVDGVELINILPLEAYIAGVLPYETSNEWPLETLKAFAITVRSFTLTYLGHHSKAYGFDLCNTDCCQVYKGMGRVNDIIMRAVTETRGQVMTYKNNVVEAYYSSSMGGVTVSASDAWDSYGDFAYLSAVETPWEDYMNHNNGFWIYEVDPETLCERLNRAGYDNLRDSIESMEILELAKNSTYVKRLKATDVHGNSALLEYTDTVRTSLTPYVKSANFVVGKGSVEYSENGKSKVTISTQSDKISYDKDYGYMTNDEVCVLTSSGQKRAASDGETIKVLTSEGLHENSHRDIFAMAKENTAAYLGDEYLIYSGGEGYENSYSTEIISGGGDSETVYKRAYASSSRNFIFAGKGWGHGVGMSQWGAHDLGMSGKSCNEILNSYFTGIEIKNYRNANY